MWLLRAEAPPALSDAKRSNSHPTSTGTQSTTARNIVWSVKLAERNIRAARRCIQRRGLRGQRQHRTVESRIRGGVRRAASIQSDRQRLLWRRTWPAARVNRGLRKSFSRRRRALPYVEGDACITLPPMPASLSGQRTASAMARTMAPYRVGTVPGRKIPPTSSGNSTCATARRVSARGVQQRCAADRRLADCLHLQQPQRGPYADPPRAPSLIAVDKHSGRSGLARRSAQARHVLHGQWSSPVAAERQRPHAGAVRRRRRLAARVRRGVGPRSLAI